MGEKEDTKREIADPVHSSQREEGEGKEVITVGLVHAPAQPGWSGTRLTQLLTSDEDHSEVDDRGDDSGGGGCRGWGQEGEDLCEATCVEFRPV